MEKVKVGIIGCGNISKVYFENCKKFASIDLIACADLDLARARERAEEFELQKAYSVDELLQDDEIELVINLTIPQAHADICLRALEAGKHVYVEKPLAVTLEDGKKIVALAKEKGLRVGSAPETFMGAGIQTSRKLIDEGWIGVPLSATGFMLGRGHEHWHPSPDFYYQAGGGPMFDMGPYYLTAFCSILGPIRRIAGSAKITFPERTISSKPRAGEKIKVEIPTHVAGIMDFEQGTTAVLVTSFDTMAGSDLANTIEIHGSEGTLRVPDPNNFGGSVQLRRHNQSEWREIPLSHAYETNTRGIGAADMAYAIRSGRAHRAHGDMALHVLEAMHGFHISSNEDRFYFTETRFERPAPMPAAPTAFTLDQ